MKKFATLPIFVLALLCLLVSSPSARACDRSELTFLGITGSNMPFGPYVISVRLCVGMGVTGSTLGADQRTNTFMFAFWSSKPSLTITAFTPATVTGPPTTFLSGVCNTPNAGCTNNGSIVTAPTFQGSTDMVRYAQGGPPCGATKSYGCITTNCNCGPAQALCTTHTFTTNVIPDSMRATGIEGAGNNIGGCYPDADMKIDFNVVFPCLWGDIAGERGAAGVTVKWSTLRETNVDYFLVERSTDGLNYESIGQVSAIGNSDAEAKYQFLDPTPQSGANLYRMVFVDRNGESQDSRSIEVNYFTPEGMNWGAVGPNPTSGELNLSFYSPQASNVSLLVYDAAGRRVLADEFATIKGGNARQLDLSSLGRGSYFIHLQDGTQKLIRKVVRL